MYGPHSTERRLFIGWGRGEKGLHDLRGCERGEYGWEASFERLFGWVRRGVCVVGLFGNLL